MDDGDKKVMNRVGKKKIRFGWKQCWILGKGADSLSCPRTVELVMWGFETTIQKILSGAVIYIVLVSSAIFIHWMWFSGNDLVIGRQHKRNRLKPGETVMLRGLALPSAYYEKHKKKEEESKGAPSVVA